MSSEYALSSGSKVSRKADERAGSMSSSSVSRLLAPTSMNSSVVSTKVPSNTFAPGGSCWVAMSKQSYFFQSSK